MSLLDQQTFIYKILFFLRLYVNCPSSSLISGNHYPNTLLSAAEEGDLKGVLGPSGESPVGSGSELSLPKQEAQEFDPCVGKKIRWRRKWQAQSTILAWRLTWTGERSLAELQSCGCKGLGHEHAGYKLGHLGSDGLHLNNFSHVYMKLNLCVLSPGFLLSQVHFILRPARRPWKDKGISFLPASLSRETKMTRCPPLSPSFIMSRQVSFSGLRSLLLWVTSWKPV